MNQYLCLKLNSKGQSLIQVLVSIGLMSILITLFASIVTSQQKEIKSLTEKQAYIEFSNFAIDTLSTGEVCKFETNNPTVQTLDLTPDNIQNAKFTFNELHTKPDSTSPMLVRVGDAVSSLTNSLVVKSIELAEFSGGGPSYLANWVIKFDEEKTVRALKPLKIKTMVNFDTANLAASKVQNCKAEGETKQVFALKAVFYNNGNSQGNICLGINSSPPNNPISLSDCNPIACPAHTTEVSKSVVLSGFMTAYNSATGHYSASEVFNIIRLCETQYFSVLYTNHASYKRAQPSSAVISFNCYGNNTNSPGNPFNPYACRPPPCRSGDTEIANYIEGFGGTLNEFSFQTTIVCGK